jgi:hypothetical protein
MQCRTATEGTRAAQAAPEHVLRGTADGHDGKSRNTTAQHVRRGNQQGCSRFPRVPFGASNALGAHRRETTAMTSAKASERRSVSERVSALHTRQTALRWATQ